MNPTMTSEIGDEVHRAYLTPAVTSSPPMGAALIIDAVRTPHGPLPRRARGVRPDDLAAHAIAAAVERTGIDPAEVADVYWGAANQSGEDNRDVARMASLLAGLPVEVPASPSTGSAPPGSRQSTRPRGRCGSDEADLYLAGGSESMSRAPWVIPKPEAALPRGEQTMYDTALGWRLINPRMAERYSTEAMGETAENVAERHSVSRADQDAFALRSHQRAVAAQAEGRFAEQLVAVEAPNGRATTLVEADEGPRADTSLERLAALRPAFREGGSVTAGNASTLNDGAACLVLASERKATELGAEPLARVVATGVAGVDPAFMGIGPVPAIRRALDGRRARARRDRPDRDQRGVRRPGARLRARARDRRGAAQRQRRRDRARTSARLLRRPAADDARLGAAPARRALRDRLALRRRRTGRRDGDRARLSRARPSPAGPRRPPDRTAGPPPRGVRPRPGRR